MNIFCWLSILIVYLSSSPAHALPVGPRIPDGNAGVSVNSAVYIDSGAGFHENEGTSKYTRAGPNPRQQNVETVRVNELQSDTDRHLAAEDESERRLLRFLNRQILSVADDTESGTTKSGQLFNNLGVKLEVQLKMMTWEFQQTALAVKENLTSDHEREEARHTIEADIDAKVSEIANEFRDTGNAEHQEQQLAKVRDEIKRRMGLIFSHNTHYDKDNL